MLPRMRLACRFKKRSMTALPMTFAQKHHDGNRHGASSVLVAAPPRCATLLAHGQDAHATMLPSSAKMFAKKASIYEIAMQSLCVSDSAVLYLKNIHMLLIPDRY